MTNDIVTTTMVDDNSDSERSQRRHLQGMAGAVVMLLAVMTLLLATNGCGGGSRIAATGALPGAVSVPRSGTVFVGDSIIGRWDLDSYFPGKGYVNAGWFGQRTDQMLAVEPQILDGSRVCHGYTPTALNPPDPAFPFSCTSITPPERIVIILGWNDLFQDRNSAVAYSNIRAMAAEAQAVGVRVVLVTLYRYDSAHPANWMKPWDSCSEFFPYRDSAEPVLNQGIRDTAAALHLPLVELEKSFVCQSDYTIDGVHPNANGYQQMAEAMKGVL